MQVGLEKFALGAKLLLDFAFGPHPHVLNVLGVNFTVVQIHKMCLVDDDWVSVNLTPDRVNVSIRRPAIWNDVSAR